MVCLAWIYTLELRSPTYRGVRQTVPVGFHVELYSGPGPGQRRTAPQHNGEQDVREQRHEIRRLKAFKTAPLTISVSELLDNQRISLLVHQGSTC